MVESYLDKQIRQMQKEWVKLPKWIREIKRVEHNGCKECDGFGHIEIYEYSSGVGGMIGVQCSECRGLSKEQLKERN